MNPFDLMKNMKQIQEKLQTVQGKIPDLRAEGEAGAGMVKVSIDGTFKLQKLFIDPSVIDPKDPEFLQDLILAATRQAHDNMKKQLESEMSEFNIPGGMPPGMF